MGELLRALEVAAQHKDPELRRRAEERALAWEEVVTGIASGTLSVGSRTPVADTPAWVTLDVARGGFATGRFVAEGPLQAWEVELDAALPTDFDPGLATRHRLNSWYLTDQGLAQLQLRIVNRTFAVDVPEEAALLVVAWLMDNGFEGAALDLVADLYPLVDRLRFYPRPAARPFVSGATVHLRTAGEVAAQLEQISVPDQITSMRDALTVWNPLLDRLVRLWLDTYLDDWPCQQWPASWAADREAWLTDFHAAAHNHPTSRHLKERSPFMAMSAALERCPKDSAALSPRDVGRLRKAIRDNVERWGAPDSKAHADQRSIQKAAASLPTHRAIATAVADRLRSYRPETGVPELSMIVDSVQVDGAEVHVPTSLLRKTERALEAPVEELVGRGVIGSAEVLAIVLPQISSQAAAADFEDRDLRALYSQIYQAFRKRRSLLLLNLEHQVQIEELPWVKAIAQFRAQSQTARRSAKQTLAQTAQLTLTSFPQTILPNPMVRELSALAKAAEVEIPFVEEVAADIFMGTFTTKWRAAARFAAEFLHESLYARYYDLPTASTWTPLPASDGGLLDKARTRWGTRTADDFARICGERSTEAVTGDGSFVARNGAIIEQSQILTTHNLAPLVHELGLSDELSSRAPQLASDTFGWIVRQQTQLRPNWRSRLQMTKNTAYAWRQALFFLSLTETATQRQVIAGFRDQWAPAPADWRDRFEPALTGLERIAAGARFDDMGRLDGGRRFLGWSVGPHWMAATEQRPDHGPL